MVAEHADLMHALREVPRLSSATVRHVEHALREYHALVEEHQDLVNEVASLGLGHRATDEDAPARSRGYDHADPTASSVLLLADHTRLAYLAWLLPRLRAALSALPPERRRLVELRYWRRLAVPAVCDALGISPATFHRWRICVITAVALRLGWR